VVTLYGVCATSFMMLMYATERRGPRYIAGFAVGCVASSIYGWWSGAWPFGIVEMLWAVVAWRRFQRAR
jgi:CHASE2 domain-containing sensor protein